MGPVSGPAAAESLLGEDLLLVLCFDLAGGSGGILGLLEFTRDLLGGDEAAEAGKLLDPLGLGDRFPAPDTYFARFS